MILSNTETIPGKEIIEIMGIARGSTVRARNIGRGYICRAQKYRWWRN
jgi:uncharacterized protein YbjQ (UPF0145 family)